MLHCNCAFDLADFDRDKRIARATAAERGVARPAGESHARTGEDEDERNQLMLRLGFLCVDTCVQLSATGARMGNIS